MSTIVNTPTASEDSSMAVLLVGILFTVVVIALFFIYGLPAIQSMTNAGPSTIEVTLPTPTETPAPAPAPAPTPTATP